MPAFVDLTGKQFGRLRVLRRGPAHRTSGGHAAVVWACRCDCGAEHLVKAGNLRTGSVQSCGCMRDELLAQRSRTHGHTISGRSSAEFRAWSGMKRRCLRPQSKDWPNYGGRGIKVCDRWVDSFAAFLADMGSRPSPSHSIERLDVNGNYEPGNCVWATAKEQQRNRRDNVRLHAFGDERCVAEWAEKAAPADATIRGRLKLGWEPENAISKPVARKTYRRIMVTRDGRTMSLRAWAKECGLPYTAVVQRVSVLGWPAERALTEPLQTRA